jgi:hypothetical protein
MIPMVGREFTLREAVAVAATGMGFVLAAANEESDY